MTPSEVLVIPLDDLAATSEGERETYSLEAEFQVLNQDFTLISPVEFKVTLMKLKEGIHALIENFRCTVSSACIRCGKSANEEISIKKFERIYYFNQSDASDEDPFDIYLVDKANNQIDLSEMIRQEIILNFSNEILCSTDCQGVCLKCGKELNVSQCSCKKVKIENSELPGYKPLSKLKDLFKDNQN